MNKILTQRGETQKIADLFKVDRRSVYSALNGTYDSELIRKIRKVAIDRGAIELIGINSLKIKINENDQTTTNGLQPLAAH